MVQLIISAYEAPIIAIYSLVGRSDAGVVPRKVFQLPSSLLGSVAVMFLHKHDVGHFVAIEFLEMRIVHVAVLHVVSEEGIFELNKGMDDVS